jgi:hypothetical protein
VPVLAVYFLVLAIFSLVFTHMHELHRLAATRTLNDISPVLGAFDHLLVPLFHLALRVQMLE